MATNDEAAPSRPRRRRWTMVALLGSLAVNLLVAGMVAGAFLGEDRRNPGRDDRRPSLREVGGATPLVMALPREERHAMLRDLRAGAGDVRASRAALRVRFEALLAALRTEPFDRARVAELMAEQRRLAGERQAVGEALLLDRLEAATPAARAAYADRLDRSLRRGSKGGRRGGSPRNGD